MAGYAGTIYDFIKDIREGKTWMDFVQSGVDIYQFCSSAAQTYKNYKKIGNIVGAKQARAWWIKKITGLRPLGRASSAKTWTTRFKNNLTNQTSPFHTQWKGIVEDAKGINGKGLLVLFGEVFSLMELQTGIVIKKNRHFLMVQCQMKELQLKL